MKMKTYSNTYHLSAYRVTAESMADKEQWPTWMRNAHKRKSLTLSINGQYWTVVNANGGYAVPWGHYLVPERHGYLHVICPEVFQNASYTREAEPESADDGLGGDAKAEERLAWIREKAVEIFKDITRNHIVGHVTEAAQRSVEAATQIYDKAGQVHACGHPRHARYADASDEEIGRTVCLDCEHKRQDEAASRD